jgi:hypothetical protein
MDGIAWACSAMTAARARLEIATQNLANVSTGGFQRIEARGFLTSVGIAITRHTSSQGGALRNTGRARFAFATPVDTSSRRATARSCAAWMERCAMPPGAWSWARTGRSPFAQMQRRKLAISGLRRKAFCAAVS